MADAPRQGGFKRSLKVFLIGLIGLIVVTVVIGLLLPSRWEAETSTTIKAEPAKIHTLVANFDNWKVWATENMKTQDPDAVVTFSGPPSGAGATMSWESAKMGRGRLTITKSDPQKGIWYESAIESDEINGEGWVTYERDGENTKVTWHDEGDLPPVIGGYFRGTLNQALEEHFSKSLAKLKEAAEK